MENRMHRHWFRSSRRQTISRLRKPLRLEILEDRHAPAVITVTATNDALNAPALEDGVVSLREAIVSINNGADFNADITANRFGTYGTNDTINFNIGASGTVQTINVGITGNGALPALTVPMTINGYSESGASMNTLPNGDNAKILIELNGANAGPNADGLLVSTFGAGSIIEGLAINRFSLNGIELQGGGCTIAGNFVGTNPLGNAAEGNQNDGIHISHSNSSLIGGTSPGARNIVSGNQIDGIHIVGTTGSPATGNLIEGNFVGVNATGTGPVGFKPIGGAPGTPGGNCFFGIEISGGNANSVGGSTAGARNVVGLNADGIEIDNGGENNIIQGNYSGVGADGVTPVGNNLHGIVLRSDDNLSPPLGPGQANEPAVSGNIIGVNPNTFIGLGNIVAFNGTGGIAIFGNPLPNNAVPIQNSGNSFLGNAIFENGRNFAAAASAPIPLLGIDLTNSFVFPRDGGVTGNDSSGHGAANDPNNFQNFPLLTGIALGNGAALIRGTFAEAAEPNTTLRIEFFANNPDPLGLPAEGQTFLGATNIKTNASGQAVFAATLPVGLLPGQIITATATNLTADPSAQAGAVNVFNTSEFSPGRAVSQLIAVGAGAGGGPEVKVYDAATGALKFDFFAFAPNFTGGVSVATGDVNCDGVPDIIVGAGPSGGPDVKVFSGVDGHLLQDFFAYDLTFTGGVSVAAADVNADGCADIITGAGAGGGPNVKVFDGKTEHVLANFFAYPGSFTGGVRVAGADVNGDGKADIITGPGAGGRPELRVFSGTTQGLLFDYFAFSPAYTGGITVAGADLNGDGKAEMIVGQSQGVGAAVRTFSGADSHMLLQVTPFATGSGGVSVTAADRDDDGLADVLVGTGPGIASDLRSFKGTTLAQIGADINPFDPSFLGGIHV